MEFRTIGISELWNMRAKPDVYMIDLRDKEDYQKFHIEGAHNHPYDEMTQWLGDIPKEKKIILYCEHGSLSMMAAKTLSRMRYEVYTLVGGISSLNS
jgi:rhodanese-related sulfurtransferase